MFECFPGDGEGIGAWPKLHVKMKDSLLLIDNAGSFSIKEKQLDITGYWYAMGLQ